MLLNAAQQAIVVAKRIALYNEILTTLRAATPSPDIDEQITMYETLFSSVEDDVAELEVDPTYAAALGA